MKFDQLRVHNMRNIFLERSECGGDTIAGSFSTNPKLRYLRINSLKLDTLYFYLMSKSSNIEIY